MFIVLNPLKLHVIVTYNAEVTIKASRKDYSMNITREEYEREAGVLITSNKTADIREVMIYFH